MPPSAVAAAAARSSTDLSVAWGILVWAGVVFTLLGAVEMALIWFPPNIGSVDWEFGTVSSFFDSLPLLGLGLGFLVAGGLARGSRWIVRSTAVALVLLALFTWAAAALYVTDLPLVFGAAPDLFVLRALKKAVLKGAVQTLVYPFGFLWIAAAGWRRSGVRKG
jgi:hypothetical protein